MDKRKIGELLLILGASLFVACFSSGQGYQKNSNVSNSAVVGDSLKSSDTWILHAKVKQPRKYPFTPNINGVLKHDIKIRTIPIFYIF